MTSVASIAMKHCHTLAIITKKDQIAISRWFDLSVVHNLTVLPKFIYYNPGQNMVSKWHVFIESNSFPKQGNGLQVLHPLL